jgi:hypothetical protein
MIDVERLVREYFKGIKNAFCLVFYACCREVKNFSETKITQPANMLPKSSDSVERTSTLSKS